MVRPLLIRNLLVNYFTLEFPALILPKPTAEEMKMSPTFKNEKTQSRPSKATLVPVRNCAKYDLSTLSMFQEIRGLETKSNDKSRCHT